MIPGPRLEQNSFDLKCKAKPGSLWTCVTLRSADPKQDGSFELCCHACDKRCYLGKCFLEMYGSNLQDANILGAVYVDARS
jgi:hypothetical protein